MREAIINQLTAQPKTRSIAETLQHVSENPVTKGNTPPSGFINTIDTNKWYERNKHHVFTYIEITQERSRPAVLSNITGLPADTVLEALVSNTTHSVNAKHLITLWALQEVADAK